MSENYSYLYTCSICCVYPILVHLGIVWLTKYASRIDWQNIRFPWRRNND